MHQKLTFFSFSFLLFFGFSSIATNIASYANVTNYEHALELMQSNNHLDVILVKPIKTGNIGKIVEIRRGANDHLLHNQVGIKSSWTNASDSSTGCIDFAQKPANMNFNDFMEEATNTHKTKFFLGQNTYEIVLNTKRNELKLIGQDGFEVKKLADGSIIFFLGNGSANAETNFVLNY